ncbi:MAG: DUF2125 domain-containing protein [Devosiaceae bacterium]|nr:DUF2125 domain-containing protein [Devosiaceae bacterium MH13]
MTESATPTPKATSTTRRRFLWLVTALVALAVLVTAAWFVAAQVYRAALDQGREELARQGVTLTCGNERFGGYPARFEVRCESFGLSDARGSSAVGTELTTVAPAWNPLLTIAEWSGPFALSGLGGTSALVESALLRASVRVGTDGGLRRVSAVLDPYAVQLDGAASAIASGSGAELHIRAPQTEQAAQTDLEAALLIFGFQSPLLGGVETIDLSLSGIAADLASARGTTPRQLFADWVERSGQLDGFAGRLRLDGHAINLDGDAQIAPDGLLDFEGTIATNDVAALVELFGVDDDRMATAITAGAGLFGTQTTIGEDSAIELPLTVTRGQLSVGPVTLGALPPLVF